MLSDATVARGEGIRRVLFVDDEPMIVSSFQRLFRPHRAEWDVSIATSGPNALELMAKTPMDVVVSDMRMPEMDGAEFLTIAKDMYPRTMRVVLSGQTDPNAMLRVLPVAHRFLSKPTPLKVLVETIRRVVMMQTKIADRNVQAAIGGLGVLPTLPSICQELALLLARPDVNMSAVAEILEHEPALIAKILQLVNSALFSDREGISNIGDAIRQLGSDSIKNLIISVAVVNSLPPAAKDFDTQAFNEHSLAVAKMASVITGEANGDTTFASGLLHDVGQLVIASTMPDLYDAIVTKARETGLSFEGAEQALGGCAHTTIGGALLHLWGLPDAIVDVILSYQTASSVSAAPQPPGSNAIHIAHRLIAHAERLEASSIADAVAGPFESEEERDYLARLGLLDRLAELKDAAARLVGAKCQSDIL